MAEMAARPQEYWIPHVSPEEARKAGMVVINFCLPEYHKQTLEMLGIPEYLEGK